MNQRRYRNNRISGVLASAGSRTVLIVIVCALAGLFLLAPAASAAIEVFDPSVAPAATSYGSDVQIQQFDPSLGTLDSISIMANGTGHFTQFFENMGPSAGQLTIGQTLGMVLEMPGQSSPILALGQTESHTYKFSSFDGVLNFGGASGANVTYPITASGQTTITSPATLAQFTGTGFEDLYLNADGEIALPSGLAGGNFVAGGLLTAGADFTVQYDYSTVPEASTWLGAGAALLALVVWWRRSEPKRA